MDEIDPNLLPPLPTPETLDPTKPRLRPTFSKKASMESSAFQKSIEFLEIIGEDEWHLIEGRYGKTNPRDIRIDIVEGVLPQEFEPGFTIKDGSLRQICHMHPLSPATLEGSHNTQYYMHLFHQIPNLLRGLTKEIAQLREENKKLKGDTK